METPHLSAFLHCPAWEQHLLDQTKQVIAQPEGLYTRHSLPASRWHKGQYWQANRLNIQPGWQLPSLPQRPWFIRLQAQDFLGHQALTYFLTNNQIAHVRVPSYQPKQTQFLDLRQNLDQILDQMKPKHRYNIKVAEKNGLQVEIIQHQLFEALPRFLHILEETNARHGLIAHPRAHYASILKALEPEHQAWLVFAKLGSKDIATAMIIVCGEVGTYLHGGSDYTQRAQMAPYLMHYQIIQALKEQGAHYYDLWGTNAVSSPDVDNSQAQPAGLFKSQTGHSSEGTTRFKLGFGGWIVHYPPTLDLILDPFWYSLYTSLKKLRPHKPHFND